VEDAGSKNGSALDGVALTDSAELRDRAVVSAGQTLLLFLTDGTSFADEPDLDLVGVPPGRAHLATLYAHLAQAFLDLEGVAESSLPVLIHGETGTGKELLAQSVHEDSGRESLVAVNCGALPPTLVTSELFGAKKGAYSGATANRRGLIRAADGGTLFLDEIAEMPLDAQAVLLRVLQEGEVLPVGSDQPERVDVRIVAASHQDLLKAVREGRFREDLYARLAGYQFTVPPLRERPADIGLIVGTLVERENARLSFTPDAARAFFDYHWPRNVREVRHALASSAAVAKGTKIDRKHLPEALRSPRESESSAREDPEATEQKLRASLARHQGNVSAAARDLGTSRSQVRRLAARFGIDLDSFRG
ncbi:MAG: sigma 54-interacting transcriptional regulator, partial [Myxococcota bacterium]